MVKHFLWDMTGKFGAQIVSLLLSFVLTRLLEPAEFGIAGIAMVMVFISSIFLDMGFAKALVQYKATGKKEYSSVFFLHLLLGALLMLTCFFVATPIAAFYKQPTLAPVLKTLSALFVINSLALVPGAILQREMKFKWMAVSGLTGAAIAGVISIVMAWKGYGVWSLVTQYLVSATLTVALNFYFARWHPSRIVNINALKPLWSYGSRMFFSGLLSTIVTRLDVFIIGKLFNATTLGFYTRAQSIDSTVRAFSAGSLSSVFFPAAARMQDDRPSLAGMYTKYLHFAAFVSVGIAGLLYLITPDLFVLLFTEKWNTAAIYFQIMCIAGFAWPINMLMVNVIAGTGNSKAYLRLEMIRVAFQLPVYVFGILTGITGFLWMLVGLRILSLCYNAWYVSKEVPVKMKRQLFIVCIYVVQGGIALLLSDLLFRYLPVLDPFLRVVIYVCFFGGIYMLLQYLIKTNALKEMNVLYRKWIAVRKSESPKV